MSTEAEQLAQIEGYADRIKAPTAEQGSAAWLLERVAHCTASRFKHVLDIKKNGDPGAKRQDYVLELVYERLAGRPYDHFVNKAMQDGLEREPAAKMAYEERTGRILTSTGFTHHTGIQFVGASPDALVDDDGLVECKAPTAATHLKTLLNGMDADHMPQVQGQMWITGRKWCDFVSYHPDFPAPLDCYIQRIERDDKFIENLQNQVIVLLAEVAAMVKQLKERAHGI